VSEVAYKELAGGKNAEEFSGALLEANAKAVILTRGREGVWLRTRDDGPLLLGAFGVDVADTTGAGDVFHGAFAVAVSEGQGLKESVEFASAAAAHACTALGCRGALPTRDDVQRLLGGDRPQWRSAD
jgi:sulfofructose kinase